MYISIYHIVRITLSPSTSIFTSPYYYYVTTTNHQVIQRCHKYPSPHSRLTPFHFPCVYCRIFYTHINSSSSMRRFKSGGENELFSKLIPASDVGYRTSAQYMYIIRFGRHTASFSMLKHRCFSSGNDEETLLSANGFKIHLLLCI